MGGKAGFCCCVVAVVDVLLVSSSVILSFYRQVPDSQGPGEQGTVSALWTETKTDLDASTKSVAACGLPP